VKQSHHAQFDEAWYMHPDCPPAAQLLYDLGLEVDQLEPQDTEALSTSIPWPPLPLCYKKPGFLLPPLTCLLTPLLLRETLAPSRMLTAAAALTVVHDGTHTSSAQASQVRSSNPSDIVSEYLIGKHNMATVYMSPDPYFEAFEEIIDLRKLDIHKHHTAGLCLMNSDNQLILGGMTPGTPGAKIP
jgi:hypothetical protein